MKINYIAIAEKAEKLGACGVTNDLKLAARNGETEKANRIILTNIAWLCSKPKMESVIPKQLWKIIADEELDFYDKMMRIMKAFKMRRLVKMRESYSIVDSIYLVRKNQLYLFDVYVNISDGTTCYVLVWERTNKNLCHTLRDLPIEKMSDPDYVIKVCLKRIKENSNEN